MKPQIESLKKRITRIQEELGTIQQELETMDYNESVIDLPFEIKKTDKKASLKLIDRLLEQEGMDLTVPDLSPEDVQEEMRKAGIKPQDNIGSQAIQEAREEHK